MLTARPLITVFFNLIILSFSQFSYAQQDLLGEDRWYERINVRGYIQGRYNRLLETNLQLRNEQGDKTWGDKGGISLRRVRLVLSGQVSDRISFYIQPDFASTVSGGGLHFGQLRDAYFDIGIDKKSEYRIRIGQSKIPFGFENLQSSQNRLPLDRADGTNSSFVNERDVGAFFYWAPGHVRETFRELVSRGLKGSGDYGLFAFGVFNGQAANKPDLNNKMHLVSRISIPIRIGSQIIEPGIQAYSGTYTINPEHVTSGVQVASGRNYLDQRLAASFVLYPQPFGIQAEFNTGRGPVYNRSSNSIESADLEGGYVLMSYRKQMGRHTLIPFARAHYYQGGKKHETDARGHDIRELEIGLEWQPFKEFEFVGQYTLSSRNTADHLIQINNQEGRLLRLQAQLNF